MKQQLVITCEHASNAIPKRFHALFHGQKRLLDTHRGLDIGALPVYQQFSRSLDCLHLAAKWSRLLVDLNRSLHHQNFFSEYTKTLSHSEKELLVDNYYLPYREQVKQWIQQAINNKSFVIHLSIHSFTPQLATQRRNNDIGLLYDPKHPLEKLIATLWKQAIQQQDDSLIVRMNYPYKGISDGFTNTLRNTYKPTNYLGIELEMNQKHFTKLGKCKTTLDKVLLTSFKKALNDFTKSAS